MVLFSRSICSILLSSLKCSSRFSSLRIATYKLFVFWCNTANTSSCVEEISDSFITSIIQDTKPFVVKVHLQVNGMNGKNKPSKRLKRRLGENYDKDESEDENVTEKHLNAEKYEDLCTEALNCLRQLIRCGSSFMKSHQMKRIYEHAMTLIMQNVEIDRKKRPLYANRDCRRSLFLVLKELLVSSFTITLPQSQFLIHVFAQAQHIEHWHENRILCGEILGDLERVIHPQKLEFKFPPREEIEPLKMSCTQSQDNILLPSSDEDERIPETFPVTDLSPDKPSSQVTDETVVMVKDTDEVKETESTEIHIEEDELEKAPTIEADEVKKDEKDDIIPIINEENQRTEKAATTQDIVLEIDSDESNEVQELSDEEIVFTPVPNPPVTTPPFNSPEPQQKRPRKSLIIIDEDSNDEDVTDLVSCFVDDP